jgi:hypothetical protein
MAQLHVIPVLRKVLEIFFVSSTQPSTVPHVLLLSSHRSSMYPEIATDNDGKQAQQAQHDFEGD